MTIATATTVIVENVLLLSPTYVYRMYHGKYTVFRRSPYIVQSHSAALDMETMYMQWCCSSFAVSGGIGENYRCRQTTAPFSRYVH